MEQAIHTQTLLNGLVERHKMPLSHFRDAVKEVLIIIKAGLLRDGIVKIHNFGTFRLKRIAEHKGRNPQTGEVITIKASNRAVFTPAKALRDLVEPNRAKATPVPDENTANKNNIRNAALTANSATHESITVASPKPDKNNQEDAQSIKLNGKTYFLGTSAAIAAIMLIFLLQQDKEITNQSIITDQPAPAVTVQDTPAAPTKQVITEITTNQEEEITDQTAEPDIQAIAEPVPVAQATPVEQEQTAPYFEQQKYQLAYGDSLWRLAKKNYGNALFWPIIFQANQNSISNPDRLRENREISLPTLHGQPDELTKQDRYNIANGYYLAYLHYKSIGDKDGFFALLEAKRYSPQLVNEKMDSLTLSQVEKLLLRHQPKYN